MAARAEERGVAAAHHRSAERTHSAALELAFYARPAGGSGLGAAGLGMSGFAPQATPPQQHWASAAAAAAAAAATAESARARARGAGRPQLFGAY